MFVLLTLVFLCLFLFHVTQIAFIGQQTKDRKLGIQIFANKCICILYFLLVSVQILPHWVDEIRYTNFCLHHFYMCSYVWGVSGESLCVKMVEISTTHYHMHKTFRANFWQYDMSHDLADHIWGKLWQGNMIICIRKLNSTFYKLLGSRPPVYLVFANHL